MKTYAFVLFLFSFSSIASAKGFNYTCSGKDQQKKNVVVNIADVTLRNRATSVNVTVTVNNESSYYRSVSVYVGDEGFDYGITTNFFMLWIHHQPHGLSNHKIAGSYFSGKDWNLDKRTILKCVKH